MLPLLVQRSRFFIRGREYRIKGANGAEGVCVPEVRQLRKESSLLSAGGCGIDRMVSGAGSPGRVMPSDSEGGLSTRREDGGVCSTSASTSQSAPTLPQR